MARGSAASQSGGVGRKTLQQTEAGLADVAAELAETGEDPGTVESLGLESGSGSLAKTMWGLADQGVVSAGNFLTNLLLLRALPPAEFGSYALLLNAMIFLNTMQQSLIGYPLCVRGAQATGTRFRWIVTGGLLATVGMFAVNVLVLLAACLWTGQLPLLVPLVAALLFWQTQDTLRVSFISQLRQRAAVPGDALGYLGQALVVGLLWRFLSLNIAKALWVAAGTSLAAFALQWWQLRPAWPERGMLRPIFGDFWRLGRWSVPARVMGFFTLQAFPWVIAARHGTAQVATYQALFQLLALANPILLSMGNLITASIARSDGRSARAGTRYGVLTLGLTWGYLLVLGVGAPLALRLLYGGRSSYAGDAAMLRIFALAWVFEAVALVSTATLGGMERVKGLFWVQLSGCLGAVLVALPLVYLRGVAAAGTGLLLVNVVRAVVGMGLVAWAVRGKGEPAFSGVRP